MFNPAMRLQFLARRILQVPDIPRPAIEWNISLSAIEWNISRRLESVEAEIENISPARYGTGVFPTTPFVLAPTPEYPLHDPGVVSATSVFLRGILQV